MKNLLLSLKMSAAFLFLLLFACSPVFAQGGVTIEFGDYFTDFGAFVLVVPVVVEFIKRAVPNAPHLANQIISWAVGVGLAMLAWALDLGFFAEIVTWWQALVIGFGSSLAANGVFDTGLITWIFSLIKIKSQA